MQKIYFRLDFRKRFVVIGFETASFSKISSKDQNQKEEEF